VRHSMRDVRPLRRVPNTPEVGSFLLSPNRPDQVQVKSVSQMEFMLTSIRHPKVVIKHEYHFSATCGELCLELELAHEIEELGTFHQMVLLRLS
jgi:hypothetical protein